MSGNFRRQVKCQLNRCPVKAGMEVEEESDNVTASEEQK